MEIWLVYYKKHSGKARISYNDAVEEALCFGWIDSIVKKIDEVRFAQRFTPRKGGSKWSETNKARVRRLVKQGRMTSFGLEKANRAVRAGESKNKYLEHSVIPSDILKALKRDKKTWENFRKFPASYKRIRVGWIEVARKRPGIFAQRLRYFLKMAAKNKKFGMVQ